MRLTWGTSVSEPFRKTAKDSLDALCKESGSNDWTMHIDARQIPIYAVTLTAPDGVIAQADVMREDYPEDDFSEFLQTQNTNWHERSAQPLDSN
jgi:hypothetical protein